VLGLVALGESSVETGGLKLWCPQRVSLFVVSADCRWTSCEEGCLRRRCYGKGYVSVCYYDVFCFPIPCSQQRECCFHLVRLRCPVRTMKAMRQSRRRNSSTEIAILSEQPHVTSTRVPFSQSSPVWHPVRPPFFLRHHGCCPRDSDKTACRPSFRRPYSKRLSSTRTIRPIRHLIQNSLFRLLRHGECDPRDAIRCGIVQNVEEDDGDIDTTSIISLSHTPFSS
jgi:hypothetical protein